MNNIDRLIAELCPKGVEHLAIGEFCVLRRGESVTKNSTNPGPIPVIAGGQQPAYFIDKANRSGETIVVSSSGAYAGFVSYWDIPIFVSDAFSIEAKSDFCLKYLYYVLKNRQESIHSLKKGGGVPHVHVSDLAPMIIPLPPLPVQEEIVRILDTFSSTVAELEQKLNAERAARIRQYEHYRDELLTFESKSKIMEKLLANLCPDGVEYDDLGALVDILDSQRRPVTKSKRKPGPYPYYGANGIQDYVAEFIFDGTFLLLGEDGSVINPDGSPVLTWASGKLWVNNHAHILAEKTSGALLRYLYYYLQTVDVSKVVRGVPPKINQENLRNIKIAVPPLPVQERIISILDHFEAMVNDLKNGLPAEIALRRKQYEYYRDKLLTFPAKQPPL